MLLFPGFGRNVSEEANWYYMQNALFHAHHRPAYFISGKGSQGPFTLFMSKHFDGMAWFKFLLHINKQTDVCAGLGPFDTIENLEPLSWKFTYLNSKQYVHLMDKIFQAINDSSSVTPRKTSLDQTFEVSYGSYQCSKRRIVDKNF